MAEEVLEAPDEALKGTGGVLEVVDGVLDEADEVLERTGGVLEVVDEVLGAADDEFDASPVSSWTSSSSS